MARLSTSRALPPLGVYVHWPFCSAICPYCDFNVHLMRNVETDAWLDAYRTELRHAHGLRPDGPVETVFFGGGTPSLMPREMVAGILQQIDALWGLSARAEITLEANPVSAARAHLGALRDVGVTRLSLGVQAFDDDALAFLGRTHSADEAHHAFMAAQDIFPRASFDLIYARPGQHPDAWAQELSAALALAPQHMSLYQLTIEPQTAFAKLVAAGKMTPPDEDVAAALYEVTQELTAAAGLPAYEVSNHAAAGHACRHNVASWRGGDYLGIGPGAHGRVSTQEARFATVARRQPQAWLAGVAANGHGWESSVKLDAAAYQAEALMLGLRLVDGLPLADLQARHIDIAPPRLERLRADGLLSDDRQRLQASAKGRLLLDYVLGELLA